MTNIKKIFFLFLGFSAFNISDAKPISLAISNDGKYAVSSNDDKNVYLYDLDNKTAKKVNTKKANPYSANFIDKSDDFIYQDIDGIVYIVDAKTQKLIKKFDTGFKTQGPNNISTDLSIYVGSNDQGNIVIQQIKEKDPIKYIYGGKDQTIYSPYVPIFTPAQDKVIVTTSGGELWIFDINEILKEDGAKHQVTIVENIGQTMKDVDPNGKHVYAVDQQYSGIKYNLETGEVSDKGFYYPKSIENVSYMLNGSKKTAFFKGLTNFKFIDNDKIIATLKGVNQPYLLATIFSPNRFNWGQKKLVFYSDKYLPLVKAPLDTMFGNYQNDNEAYPITGGYNILFDTSVDTHRLVMAQANGDGIMLYKYIPEIEELSLEWVGDTPI